MKKRLWASTAMLAAGASLLVAASFASAAPSAKSSAELKKGGTLRVNVAGSDVDAIDPAIAYGTTSWEIQYSTQLKLLDYPDAAAPRGSRLGPSGATGYTVSNGGKTYTFTIRKGMKFSNGENVTPASYKRGITRAAIKDLQSPAYQFISDPNGTNIIGAQAVRAGSASQVSGVQVKGQKLIIRLTKADATFLAKISMPFFSATSTRLAMDKEVININDRNDLPTAGPYYVSQREPNRTLIVSRNPNYKGSRPRNLATINFKMNVALEPGYREVRAGQADYQLGLPPAEYANLGREFGVNRSQFRVAPSNCVSYMSLNTSRPLFTGNAGLRKAINFAINRRVMVQQYGAYGGQTHDQILPPGFPGFTNANIYPLGGPNLTKARALARGKTRSGKANLFHGLTSPGPQVMEIVRANLKAIGIDIEPRGFRGFAIYDAAGTRTSDHDITVGTGWCQDYPDPYDFVNVLLYGKSIQAEENNNLAYFNNAAYNKKMESAARLLGKARLTAYGKLDIDIMKNAAPWASWRVPSNRFFFGSRVNPRSWVYQPVYEAPIYNLLALK